MFYYETRPWNFTILKRWWDWRWENRLRTFHSEANELDFETQLFAPGLTLLIASHNLFTAWTCIASPHPCWTVSQVSKIMCSKFTVAYIINMYSLITEATVKCSLSHIICHKGSVYLLDRMSTLNRVNSWLDGEWLQLILTWDPKVSCEWETTALLAVLKPTATSQFTQLPKLIFKFFPPVKQLKVLEAEFQRSSSFQCH